MRKPRTRYHHGTLRQAAIEEATRQLDARGAEGFTLEQVARRLGVTTPALYRHFKNRDALLRAILWEEFLRFVERMDTATLTGEPEDVLRAMGRVYVRFAVEHPGWFRLQFSALGLAQDVRHEDAHPQYFARIQAALARCLGTDDPKEVERWYLVLWAFSHGLAALTLERVWQHLPSDEERLRVAEELVDTLVASLKRPSPPPPPPRRRRPARRKS